jgi:hypothetical protein
MKPASYSVIRYIADSARNEPINVGIVIWTDDRVDLRVEEAAMAHVIHENPHLDRDALAYLEEMLDSEVLAQWPKDNGGRTEMFAAFRTGPVMLTEPRETSIDDRQAMGFEVTLDRLLGRLVRPRKRRREGHPGRVTRRDVADDVVKLLRDVLRESYAVPTAETVVHEAEVVTPYAVRTLDAAIQNNVVHFGSVAISYDYTETRVQEEIDLALAKLRDIRLVYQTTPMLIVANSRTTDPVARKNAPGFEEQLKAKSAPLGVEYARVDDRDQIETVLESVLTEDTLAALVAH